jgi:hypothetical protein
VAPSATAAASETSTTPRSSSGDAPFLRTAALRPAVSPAWSAAFRSSTDPCLRQQILTADPVLAPPGSALPTDVQIGEVCGEWA